MIVAGRPEVERMRRGCISTGYLERDLLSAAAVDDGDVTKEVLVATGILLTAAGHEVPVSKKGFIDLLRSFATEVQAGRRKSQAASRPLEGQ